MANGAGFEPSSVSINPFVGQDASGPSDKIEAQNKTAELSGHARTEAIPSGPGDRSPLIAIAAMDSSASKGDSGSVAITNMLAGFSIGADSDNGKGKEASGTSAGQGAATDLTATAVPSDRQQAIASGTPHASAENSTDGGGHYAGQQQGDISLLSPNTKPELSDKFSVTSDRTAMLESTVQLGDQRMSFPTREALYNAPTEELLELASANQLALTSYAKENAESIPFIGFHGATAEKLNALVANGKSFETGTYYATIASKADNPDALVSDLEHAAKFASSYANPSWEKAPFEPGGLAVFNLNEETKNIRSQVLLRGDVERIQLPSQILNTRAPTNLAELSNDLSADEFQRMYRGSVSYQSYAEYDRIYGDAATQTPETNYRYQIAEAFKYQKIVASALKMATD